MAVAYRLADTPPNWRSGFGMALTVAVHGAALVLVLLARTQSASQPMPLAVSLIAAVPLQAEAVPAMQTLELPKTVATLHIPKPEVVLTETSTVNATVVNADATAPSVSSAAVERSRPRFDADYLNNPAPRYPALSRRLREEGVVMLRVYVAPNGLPEAVELKRSSGSARLDESALLAVRQWRFIPAREGDAPVAAWVLVPVAFSLAA